MTYNLYRFMAVGERDGLLRGIGVEVVDAAHTTYAHNIPTIIHTIRTQGWTPAEISWTNRMATSMLDFPADMVSDLVESLSREPAANAIERARLQNSLDLAAMVGLDREALVALRDACGLLLDSIP